MSLRASRDMAIQLITENNFFSIGVCEGLKSRGVLVTSVSPSEFIYEKEKSVRGISLLFMPHGMFRRH